MSSQVTGFEELEKMFFDLQHPQEMCMKAVNAASPIVEQAYKRALGSSINGTDKYGRKYSKGNLLQSVHTMKAKNNERGTYSVIGPTGSYMGVDNSQKAYWLEHGRGVRKGSNKAVRGDGPGHGYQNPKPFVQRAIRISESAVVNKMKQVIETELDK